MASFQNEHVQYRYTYIYNLLKSSQETTITILYIKIFSLAYLANDRTCYVLLIVARARRYRFYPWQ